MYYNLQIDSTLNKIKNIILDTASPDKLILFGSRARGEIRDDSDYDILVIKKGLQKDRVLTRKIHHALYKNGINVAVDLIAINDKNWTLDKVKSGMIYKMIDSEGIKIYG